MKDKFNKLKNSKKKTETNKNERPTQVNSETLVQDEQTNAEINNDEVLSSEDSSKVESADDVLMQSSLDSKRLQELEEELKSSNSKYSKLEDQFNRLRAEYDNYVKRSSKEKQERYNDALFDVCSKWLPVMDNLDRALQATEKFESAEVKSIAEGVEMVKSQALEVLASLGVEEIEATGQSFNPELHEAVLHIDDDNYPEATVVEVFQKGYKKGDKVLRYSVVKVAN